MKKKIVYGSFELESNSLTAVLTSRKDFSVSVGRDDTGRNLAYDYMTAHGCEVVHTLHAEAVPGGSVIREDFESILNDLLNAFPEGKIDGVFLRLHGAMDVVGTGSGDLAIAKAVREKIGPDVPFAVSFDLHADVDPRIAKYVNIICGYRTAPHIDIEETHLRAAKLLISCIEHKYLPKPIIVKVPIIADGDSMTTDIYPGNELIGKLLELEEESDMLCLNIFLGNPWVDALCAGGAIVAIPAPGRGAEAEKAACELAAEFWRVRGDFKFRATTAYPDEGIDWALSQPVSPVFLSDSGDNVSGGGSGDNAEVLAKFIERGAKKVLIAGIADAEVIASCRGLNKGDTLECTIGGKLDPASTAVTVSAVFKARGRLHMWPGNVATESVLLGIDGIDVLLSTERIFIRDTVFFDEFGIKPEDYRVIVVKIGYLWPELYDVAKDFMMLLTKGSTCEIMTDCDFHNVPRPIYPLDRDMQWVPEIAKF
ncbi:MAG: M81 family metallopeptidase [Oscillospiraceae bacterium]|nr:M81 family metallopeptidase [Oscillospiraceae bacterium]